MLAGCSATADQPAVTDMRFAMPWQNPADGMTYLIQDDPDRGGFFIRNAPGDPLQRPSERFRDAAEAYLDDTAPTSCTITAFNRIAGAGLVYEARYNCS